jgi:hypothetical protein
MTNKIIPISGLALALALALATGFMRLSGAVASQLRIKPQYQPPQESRVLGILEEGAKDALVAPSNVMAGEDFQVTITTIGSGCEREADTGVIVSENGATVMVYDYTTATHPGVACTMILKHLRHTVTLRFTKRGKALIQVWGRRVGSDTPMAGTPTVLERQVTVR